MKYITITFGLFLTEYLVRFLLILLSETIAPGSYGDSTWLFGKPVQTDYLFKTAQGYPFHFLVQYFLMLFPLYLILVWVSRKIWKKLWTMPGMKYAYLPLTIGSVWMVVVLLLRWLYIAIEGGGALWPWGFHSPVVYFVLGYTAAYLISRDESAGSN